MTKSECRIEHAKVATVSIESELTLLTSALIPRLVNSERTAEQDNQFDAPGTPAAVDRAMDALVEKLFPELQRYLDKLEGENFGKEANSQLAKSLTRLLRRLGCCLACRTCGEPAAAIRYVDMYQGGNWLWRFEHTATKRHGGTVRIPTLTLVRKAPARVSD